MCGVLPGYKPCRERARAASHLQHLTFCDFTDEANHGWTLVIGIESVLVVVGRVLHRHRVVLPSAALSVLHQRSMQGGHEGPKAIAG